MLSIKEHLSNVFEDKRNRVAYCEATIHSLLEEYPIEVDESVPCLSSFDPLDDEIPF